MLFTAQTTYIITLLPGTPTVYTQYAQHLAWTSGNVGCASPISGTCPACCLYASVTTRHIDCAVRPCSLP